MNKRELNISNNKLYENTPEDIILKSPFKIPPKGLQDLIDIKGVNATEYAYYDIAKKHKLDLAQMYLKFLEIQPFVSSVIIGATTMEQLKTNIESVNINLTNEIIQKINEVQKIYPNPCP